MRRHEALARTSCKHVTMPWLYALLRLPALPPICLISDSDTGMASPSRSTCSKAGSGGAEFTTAGGSCDQGWGAAEERVWAGGADVCICMPRVRAGRLVRVALLTWHSSGGCSSHMVHTACSRTELQPRQ